mmetsp:Transcript_55326/g.135504  ORF Transcript_55326/g.135504 Transcript_55326/m.135504 type:complete len:349 (+) Transcript_55326:279-1325(+)
MRLRLVHGAAILVEGSLLVELERREGVVHVAVVGLVGAHGQDEVAHRGVLAQLPVVDADGRRRGGLPLPEAPVVDGLEDPRVRVHGLLLEVPHEAVADVRVHEVGQEEGGHEEALRHHDGRPEHRPGLLQLDEGQQVHPLVLGLLEQRVDPPVVPVHPPQRPEVPQHPRRHPGHPRHRLQEDGPVHHLARRQLAKVVEGEGVEGRAQELDGVEGDGVGDAAGPQVRLLHAVDLLLGPDRVRHVVDLVVLPVDVVQLLHPERVDVLGGLEVHHVVLDLELLPRHLALVLRDGLLELRGRLRVVDHPAGERRGGGEARRGQLGHARGEEQRPREGRGRADAGTVGHAAVG